MRITTFDCIIVCYLVTTWWIWFWYLKRLGLCETPAFLLIFFWYDFVKFSCEMPLNTIWLTLKYVLFIRRPFLLLYYICRTVCIFQDLWYFVFWYTLKVIFFHCRYNFYYYFSFLRRKFESIWKEILKNLSKSAFITI